MDRVLEDRCAGSGENGNKHEIPGESFAYSPSNWV